MSSAFGEPSQYQTTPVHQLDPRVKLIVAVWFILLVNLVPSGRWWLYLAFWLILLTISSLSRLGPFYTARKSLVATPFVVAAVSIPFTTPGSPLVTLPWVGWAMTDQGLELLLSIVLRFWLAVQMAVLLVTVTRIPDLLWALTELRMPTVLVSVIAVMYRYLRVLGSEATRMLRARAARSCAIRGNRRPSLVWRGKVTGAMIGSLFLRAVGRSERIHLAMLSRGYDGSARYLTAYCMESSDWLTLFGSLLLAMICFVWVMW